MKKLIALLLALILVFSFAACKKKSAPAAETGAQVNTETETGTEEQPGEGEPENPFDSDTTIALPIILEDGTMLNPDGTPMEESGEEAPAEEEAPVMPQTNAALVYLQAIWSLYGEEEKFSIIGGNMEANIMDAPGVWDPAYKDGLTTTLLIPAEQMGSVTEAATMIHMMNTNTFTCGVVKLADGTDTAAFAQAVRDAIQGNQWMCGFPEKLIVADVGNGCVLISFGINDTMTVFESKLTIACAEAQLLFNEAITG